MFDSCIVPVLTYGSEVWGVQISQAVDHVNIKYCRKQLGVGSTTPTVAVLGECGTFPLYI